MKTIRSFFTALFGRNSDPCEQFRRDDPMCTIPWEEGLKNKLISNTLRSLQKTPYTSLYSRTILNKKFDNDIILAALETSKNYTKGLINMSYVPHSIRHIPVLNITDADCLANLLGVASAWHLSQNGEKKMLGMTKGKYKKIYLYRIHKTASTSLEKALRIALLGQPPYIPCHKAIKIEHQKLIGHFGQNGIVECSWDPLAYATESFNFAHSHYPISEFHNLLKSTYSLISLREPLDRICSFYNKLQRGNSSFDSIEDFIENCHPDWICGQLYFLDQRNSLKKARKILESFSRVLIVEESNLWSECIYSDINIKTKIDSVHKKSSYRGQKKELKKRLETLISDNNELSSKLNKEYKLYEYAKKLASN